MFNVEELSIAVALNIDVTIIFFNVSALGNVKRYQNESYCARYIIANLHNPDMEMMGRSFSMT